jgi:hypothetical protein
MAAQHVLAGERMVDAYFDNNPPMSYLIYIPAVLLSKLGIPLWYSAYIYIFSAMALFLALMASMLRTWPELNTTVYWGLLASYIVSMTIMSGHYFGTKDQLLCIVLAPLLLAQALLTVQHRLPWCGRIAIVASIPFLLLKPQFGLLPLALLLHRAIKERRWTVVLDFDCLALTLGVVCYALIIVLRFPDFLEEALRPIMVLYALGIEEKFFDHIARLLLLALIPMAFAWVADKNTPLRKAALACGSISLLAWLGFVIQGKGIPAHTLPMVSFLLPTVFLTLTLHIQAYRKNGYRLALPTVMAFSFWGIYWFRQIRRGPPMMK